MIYTKEQKREVANRLRYWGSHASTLSVHEILYNVLSVGGCDALKALADLIEPDRDLTCELEPTTSERTDAPVRVYECDSCGKSCDSVWAEDYVYCPYCGRLNTAREVVVEE